MLLANIIKLLIVQLPITYIVIFFSKKMNLLDYPNHRKVHNEPIPFTGGLVLGLSFLLIIILTNTTDKFLSLILSFGFLICLSGLIDDKYQVNPGTKIILQFIPIFFLIDQNLILQSLGKYEFFGEITLGSFDKIFTIFCCMFLINASNYSDGIDGLLASISIIIFINFAIYTIIFLDSIDIDYYILIITTLLIFLIFNLGVTHNYKIFLGDSGSNLIGFIISFLSIYLFKFKNIHPALIVWPLAYLVYEFLSVNIIRLYRNKGIFIAGNDHFHYELSKIYLINKKIVLLIIIGLNIFFSIFGYLVFKYLSADLSLFVYILLFILYFIFRFKLNRGVEQSGSSSGS